MALLPDPTTAASERSSVREQTNRVQKTNRGSRRSRGVQARSGGGAGPEVLQPAVKHEKLDKLSGAVCQA